MMPGSLVYSKKATLSTKLSGKESALGVTDLFETSLNKVLKYVSATSALNIVSKFSSKSSINTNFFTFVSLLTYVMQYFGVIE
jgi:hypothetical protein